MRKRLISRGMKIFMTILLIIGLGCYISAGVVLYNSNYKVSDYYDEIRSLLHWDEFYYGDYNKVTSKNIALDDEISNVSISTNDANIEINSHDGNELKVELYSGVISSDRVNDSINITNASGLLKITLNEEIYFRQSIIKIYVPRQYSKNIDVKSNNGEILVSNLNLNEFNIKSTTGDVELESVVSNNVAIETNDSDIKIGNGMFNTSKMNTTYGSIEAYGNLGISSLTSKDGDIELDLKGLGKSLDIISDFGDVDLNVALGVPYSIEFLSRYGEMMCHNNDYNNKDTFNSYVEGSGENKITINVKNGDIDIK